MVERLHRDNAQVFTLDKDPTLIHKLQRCFPGIKAEVCDVTNWAETQSKIKSFGPIDHLINNAGIMIFNKFPSVTESQVDEQFAVNVKAVYGVTQAVAEVMRNHKIRGTIVNVGSVTSCTSVEGLSVYGVTKAALSALTKCLALELGKDGIRCNCVSPTSIESNFFVNCLHPAGLVPSNLEEDDFSFRARTPLKDRKLLKMAEVVDTILYLLSPLSANANGADLVLDGGLSCC